jgi:ribosome-binding factor A
MTTKKQGRVAELIMEYLSLILLYEASDPRLDDVTITGVDVDRELMYATVYVTALSGEEGREDVMAGLASAMGFLRRELASRLELRRVPELRFKWDHTAAYAARIDALLDSLDISPPDHDETDAESDPLD